MVNLTKIYTRTGDSGETSIGGNKRVPKWSPIIIAIGKIDTANSAIGLCPRSDIIDMIQNDLFNLGAQLVGSKTIGINDERVEWI